MVVKGGARTGAAELSRHLQRVDTNERATVLEMRGVLAQDIDGALQEMEAVGLSARTRRPLYHASINTPLDERLTPEQTIRAIDRLEAELGLTGQARVVVEHVKHGRQHVHIVWLRIDLETMTAVPDSHNYRKHEQVSRELEQEFGHSHVQGAHVGRDNVERPKRTPTHAEMMQAERSGITPEEAKDQLRVLWAQADCGRAFMASLENAGWTLARGDSRGFVALDPTGETHSVNKAVTGVTAAKVRDRLADIDTDALPVVAEARAAQRSRRQEQETIAEQLPDSTPPQEVRDEPPVQIKTEPLSDPVKDADEKRPSPIPKNDDEPPSRPAAIGRVFERLKDLAARTIGAAGGLIGSLLESRREPTPPSQQPPRPVAEPIQVHPQPMPPAPKPRPAPVPPPVEESHTITPEKKRYTSQTQTPKEELRELLRRQQEQAEQNRHRHKPGF